MRFFRTSTLALLAFLSVDTVSQASIVINITVRNTASNPAGTINTVAGTLFQLVDLGLDGVFNRVDLSDGTTSALGQWVSGDDSLLSVAFRSGANPSDFPTTDAFDHSYSAANGTPDLTAGRMSRSFEFGIVGPSLVAGRKLGIRWWPGLQATNFATITLAVGQAYGEFTRQGTAINGGTLWVVPADGNTVTFDSMRTDNGADPLTAGGAGDSNHTVIPEPAAIGLSMIGAAGLAFFRRRRRA
jgi:PEP-CTERM motif